MSANIKSPKQKMRPRRKTTMCTNIVSTAPKLKSGTTINTKGKTNTNNADKREILHEITDEDSNSTNGDKNNCANIIGTANIDEETYSLNVQIHKLRINIHEASEVLQQQRQENHTLEKNIHKLLKENADLVTQNASIHEQLAGIVSKINNSESNLQNTIQTIDSVGQGEIDKAKNSQSYISRCNFNTGTFLTTSTIHKIQDVVKDMKPIGHGGEGRVYRAIMRVNNTRVIVKSYFMDCERSSRLEYAMLILCANLPGVKKPVGLYRTSNTHYLIMHDDHHSVPLARYIQGIEPTHHQTMQTQSHGRKRYLSDRQIQHIFSQMAHILSNLRARFIKHRDIRLDNFLINAENGQLTIIDFGWAMYSALDIVPLEEIERSGEMLMASSDYLPPEVDFHNNDNSKSTPLLVSYEKATVYALGCVLLELFFGYQGKLREKLQAHTSKCKKEMTANEVFNSFLEILQTQNNRTLCKGVGSLLNKCLRVLPNERFTLEEVLQHPWVITSRQDTTIFRDAMPDTQFEAMVNINVFPASPLVQDPEYDKNVSLMTDENDTTRVTSLQIYYDFDESLMQMNSLSSMNFKIS